MAARAARRENSEFSEASDLEEEVLFPEGVEGLVARESKNLDLEDTFSELSFSLNMEACSLLQLELRLCLDQFKYSSDAMMIIRRDGGN